MLIGQDRIGQDADRHKGRVSSRKRGTPVHTSSDRPKYYRRNDVLVSRFAQ
jgi:hypothetical protein